MTGRAVIQLVAWDVKSGMLFLGFGWIVFVATITGIRHIGSYVTRSAGNFALPAVIQRESVLREFSRRPGRRRVASLTLEAEQPGVNLRLAMASRTFFGCAFELLIDVAGGTFHCGMATLQDEELAVVEVLHITRAIVAAQTAGAVLLNMSGHESRIVRAVAICAGLRRE